VSNGKTVPSWVFERHPGSLPEQWRSHGGGWIHCTAELADGATLENLASIGGLVRSIGRVFVPFETDIGACTFLGENVTLGRHVTIGQQCSIGGDAIVGDGTNVSNQVVIGHGAKIGIEAVIKERAYLGRKAQVGDGCTVQREAVLNDRVKLLPGLLIPERYVLKRQPWMFVGSGVNVAHLPLGRVAIGRAVMAIGHVAAMPDDMLRDLAAVSGKHSDYVREYRDYLEAIAARDLVEFGRTSILDPEN